MPQLSLWRSRPPHPDSQPRLLREGCVLPPGKTLGKVNRWWLARSLYRLRVFSLAEVPAKDRRAALRNLALAWAPFDACEYRIGLHDARGLVWAWDAHQVETLLRDTGAGLSAELMPEGLLRPPMTGDGARMMACLDGLEFQVWIGGLPVVSRWWAQAPSHAEWAGFVCNQPINAGLTLAPPAMSDVAWQTKPWLDCGALDATATVGSRLEWLVASASACALVAVTAGQSSELFAVQQHIDARKAEIEQIRSSAASVFAQRDRAELAAAEAQALSQAMAVVQPVEVMKHLADVLPAKGVTVREFELVGDTLRLGLALAPEVQRSAIVKDLQSGGWFTGVAELREASGRAWVSFEMRLKGLNPPLTEPKPAVSGSASSPKP